MTSSSSLNRLASVSGVRQCLLRWTLPALFAVPAVHAETEPAFELDALEVRGIADGQLRALSEQRASGNLINVVSADAMGRFPDPNIAEALQRLPGIGIERDQGEGRFINVRGAPKEFSNVTFDGINVPGSDPDSRAVALDIFATDFATQIEVTKSIRPDQDADSIAGAVNVKSPSAIEIGQRRLLGSLASSYNNNGGTNDSRASLLFSDVFGANKEFGLTFGMNYSKTRREVDNVEHEGWDQTTLADGRRIWFFEETNFKDYETSRTRQGFNGALEFRPSDHAYFFIRAFTSKFEDDEFRYRLRLHWTDGDLVENESGEGFGTRSRPRVSYQFRHRVKTDETHSISAGGVHRFERSEWDYTVALSQAEQYYPRRDELLYRKRVPSMSYDLRENPKLAEMSIFSTNEHLVTDDYDFREYSRRTSETEENEISASTNYRLHRELFDAPARYSFGLKIRDRDKEQDADRFRDRSGAADPGVPLTDFLRDAEARNFDYILGRKHQPSLVTAYFDEVRPNAPQRQITDGILSDYEIDEEITAAYAMAEFATGGIDFIAGVRVERTRTRSEGFTYDEATDAVGRASGRSSTTDWFPGLHLKYELAEDFILRASVNQAISRPAFGRMAPFQSEDPDDRTLSRGNPDLDPTLSTNFDLSLEYYVGRSGVFSAGVFHKDLKDFVFIARTTETLSRGGSDVLYTVTQPLNSPDGSIKGYELNYQQSLDFLPGIWDGLGLFANYTFSKSEATLPDRSAAIRLPGNSRHSSNLGVYFETDRLSLQVSYNHRSSYIQEVDSLGGRDYDVYWGGRSQVDITASYQISTNFELYAQFNNVTNTKGLRYIGIEERTLEYEEFGSWITFGTKFNF